MLDAPRSEQIFASPEKIVVQEIRNIALSRRIVATYDSAQVYCLQSTNVINLLPDAPKQISVLYLLGIINSNIANHFFRLRFPGNNHIASNQLASIPIPLASKTLIEKIEKLVKERLSGNTKVEPEIERLVGDAFGLSEIARVSVYQPNDE